MTALVLSAAILCLAMTACSSDAESVSEDEPADAAETENAAEAASTSDPDFASYLGEVKTFQQFTDDPVDDADIETVLNAGINAQSGMNQQNWHFTAVTSKDIQEEINNDADTPLVIVISCSDGSEYDAGLATQAMNSAALALGYGTKIISSPTSYLNGDNREYYHELLEIPESMSAVGLLLIGKYSDTNDAVTGASTRKPSEEVTTYLP